jgi:hypothetical protein
VRVARRSVLLGSRPALVRNLSAKITSIKPYMGWLDVMADRGRGESGCSEKGEKAEIRGFVEGLNPRGALTAIISATIVGLCGTIDPEREVDRAWQTKTRSLFCTLGAVRRNDSTTTRQTRLFSSYGQCCCWDVLV